LAKQKKKRSGYSLCSQAKGITQKRAAQGGMARAVPKKRAARKVCMAVALGSKLRVKRERDEEEEEGNNQLLGIEGEDERADDDEGEERERM
jgi:hypothetical protein